MMCAIMIFYNCCTYHRVFSSINFYLSIWVAMVFFHSLKWIDYYTLETNTWLVIFATTVLAFLGFRFGSIIRPKNLSFMKEMDKKRMEKTILIISFLSMLAIIPNTFFLIRKYGFNLLSKTSQIYYDNFNGNAPPNIPYLSALAQLGCVLSGIYFSYYKFKPVIVLPVVLSMLAILPSGSRGGLILTVFFCVLPLCLKKRKILRLQLSKKQQKKKKRRIILLIVAIVLLFVALTISRSVQLDPNIYQYMSKNMSSIARVAPAVFKLYQYFASPIGVLNAYLQHPDFYFGGNTFGPLYNIINKLGGSLQYNRYQKFYNIPIETNVGTWIRELCEDFGYIGMFAMVLLFSLLVGFYEHRAVKYQNRDDIIMASVLGTIFVMTFFVWYVREGTMQVILLAAIAMRLLKYVNAKD